MSNEKLFSGVSSAISGVSNDRELVELCPEEFRQHNEWSSYAMTLFFEGGEISNWRWRPDIDGVYSHQFNCFQAVLHSLALKHQDKKKIAGWMLSEMLTEVPEHIPLKESEDS